MSAIWTRYGLRRSPFFQEPLEAGTESADLDTLFIGRVADLQTMVDRLSHDTVTRVVMIGDSGVGKTTLMNRLMEDFRKPGPDRAAWLVPELRPINLPGTTTLQDFCLEVLRQILDLRRQQGARSRAAPERAGRISKATAGARALGGTARSAVAPSWDLWERVTRLVDGTTTVSPQIAGFGITTQVIAGTPSGAHWVPLTHEALVGLTTETGRDLLLAVNNAENMGRDAADRAQAILVDARDLFQIPRTHWMFVGTPDFYEHVIKPQKPLVTAMRHPVRLDALGPADVRKLIAVRYAALKQGHALIPPVDLDAVEALARVFVGDLRELLRALESAVLLLAHRAATIGLPEAMTVISAQQREILRDHMQAASWKHLLRVVLSPPGTDVLQRFREADAVRILAPMRQATVNGHKRTWLAEGLVRSDGFTGASEWLVVTGSALLAMVPEAHDRGKPLDAFLTGRDLGQAS